MDLLQEGAQWLAGMLASHASRPVTYFRGQRSVVVPATRGRTQYESLRADGLVEQRVTVDFLIRVSALALDGEPIEPARGDRLEQVDGGVRRVFQVIAPAELREFQTDPWRTMYRIHCQLEGDAPQ